MRSIIRVILRAPELFLNGVRFAAANRDVRPEVVWSCVEWWKLAIRREFARFGRGHDPNKPVRILGMKLYSFSLDMLSGLLYTYFLLGNMSSRFRLGTRPRS